MSGPALIGQSQCDVTADSISIPFREGEAPIIGNIALNGYVSVFDMENHRIGFAKGKNCETWDDSADTSHWCVSAVTSCF